ncbi:MAG TPA: sensor histidine kinase, partial [Acidimicrobiia bacterium]|nr:sensor histidine kinase [Acidimicrobiia bacterium]
RYATTAVDVEVRAPAPGARAGRITVTVADDGPGIDPDDRPHVFERLYTSRREQGRKVGTGLGLAIVRELTAAMGGSVQLEPAPGGGTRFSVSVPGSPVASSTSTSAGSSS